MSSTTPFIERSATASPPTIPADELLELLGDEYTQQVLHAVLDEPRIGREIVARTDVSKSTVYRRLARLEHLGVVESDLVIDADGHHRKRFSTAIESIHIGMRPDGFDLSLN